MALIACTDKTCGEVLREMRESVQVVEGKYHRIELVHINNDARLLLSGHIDTSRVVTQQLLDSIASQFDISKTTLFSMSLRPKHASQSGNFSDDVIYGGIEAGDYKQKLDKYLFKMKEFIWMEASGQKIDMLNHHMERSFGMSKSRTFSLTFPKLNTEKFDIVLDDFVPELGRQKLTWSLN